jgi:hypothetical protein
MISKKLIGLIFFIFSIIIAQPAGQEIKWLRVGNLRSWFSSLGSELESGRTGSDAQQQDGLAWPAQYKYQDCIAAKSMWIGTTNYLDPVYQIEFPYKVITVGTRNAGAYDEIMPYEWKMIGRFEHPLVLVDGDISTDNFYDDNVDEIDPNLFCDRMISNKLHSSIGVSIDRKIYAFSQQNHDNYYIYDYVFKNTGIINMDGDILERTLTDVIFHFQYRYAIGHEAFVKGWAATNNINWGRNIVNQVIGPHVDGDNSNSDHRIQYSWYGPHSQAPVDWEGDWGCPNYTKGGPLGASQYVGTVILHSDTSPNDPSNDMSQPFTTKYLGNDTDNETPNQYNSVVMGRYYERMSSGHPSQTHADQIGEGYADIWGGDAGGFSQAQGFGPFDLEYGDSIRIILAEGVNGISRLKSIEVGNNWFEHEGSNSLQKPGGGTTTDNDEYKRLWVQTGIDSLFNTFDRAASNFNAGYTLNHPPAPPSEFQIHSGGDRIVLSWKGESAESHPNFDGYSIYRAIAKPDTVYEKIFECSASDNVNEFNDMTAQRGFDYYYYIVSKDDGSQNEIFPGTPLVSSKFYTMTNKPAFLRRPAGETMSEIIVVPNPFHLRAKQLQFGSSAQDRLAFYGLPPQCTIRIFTERGDLIETIDHTDGSGDELWNSTTSSRQIVVSGLYIAHFETPDGESAIRKFTVIR